MLNGIAAPVEPPTTLETSAINFRIWTSELENLSAGRMRIPFGSAAGYRAGHG
jgi:hypothetical protein